MLHADILNFAQMHKIFAQKYLRFVICIWNLKIGPNLAWDSKPLQYSLFK